MPDDVRDILAPVAAEAAAAPVRLHIGGVEPKAGWRIVNIQPGPYVDHVGDLLDVARQFPDAGVEAIYASHVIEHLGYDRALPEALKEFARILKPGGSFYISVPDMKTLCQIFLHPKADLNMRIHVMRILYGGRTDPHDIHYTGFDENILGFFLGQAGFSQMKRVKSFGLFDDTSDLVLAGAPVSLNVIASK